MTEIVEHIEGYDKADQRNLLLKMFSYEFSQNNLFLTGGTALSVFYAGHRTSKDVDLFLMKEVNLIEYVRLFRDIGKVLTTISESPTFCSYIYDGGIKADYVYDRFSAGSDKKNIVIINGVKINVDTAENIAINKICSVVSRCEPKDIIDLTWLFVNIFDMKDDFIALYRKAVEREGLLEDLLYAKGVFSNIGKMPESALNVIRNSLLKEISPKQISRVFTTFEDLISQLILSSNLGL